MSDVKTGLKLDNGDLIVKRVQDCEPIVERNKHLQTVQQKSDWGRHIATIPNVILEQWLNEETSRGNVDIKWCSPEFDAIIQKKLNDPDWRFLRTDK